MASRRKMLRGTLIAAAFLITYSVGSNFSGWAALLAALAFVGAVAGAVPRVDALPAGQHQLARPALPLHRRHGRAPTRAMLPPLALALLPVALAGSMAGPAARQAGRAAGRGHRADRPGHAGLLRRACPSSSGSVRRYQHGNYAIGGLQTRLDADVGVVYGIFIKLIRNHPRGLRDHAAGGGPRRFHGPQDRHRRDLRGRGGAHGFRHDPHQHLLIYLQGAAREPA